MKFWNLLLALGSLAVGLSLETQHQRVHAPAPKATAV